MEQGKSEREKGSIKAAVNLKVSRDRSMLERSPLWGVGPQCNSMLCTVTSAVWESNKDRLLCKT